MTLVEVKSYLSQRRRASLGDISVHFATSPDAARQLLAHWQQKGKVRVLNCQSFCNKGCNCGKPVEEIYEWIQ